MPFVESQKFVDVIDPPKALEPIEEINQVDNESPAFWSQTIPAAFKRENSIVSGLTAETAGDLGASSDYVPEFAGYEANAARFAYVYNKEQELAVKNNIDRERENEQVIRDSGWLGVASSFAAGILDPINLIPVGGQAARVYKTGNMLKGALSTARVGLLSSTVSEAAIHASQETRTWGESAANMTAGTLLSGVLGGSVGAFRDAKLRPLNKSITEIEKQIDEFLTIPPVDKTDLMVPGPMSSADAKQLGLDLVEGPTLIGEGGSVGAASRLVETNEIKTILGSERLKILALGDRSSPINRTLTSDNIKTRETVIDLAEVSYILEKNTRGVPTKQAVETVIKSNVDVAQYDLFKITSGAFEKYSGSRFLTAKAKDKIGLSGDRLKYDDFKKEIDKAMRNNDTSAIPEVAEAARGLRKMVDDVYDVAVKEGLAVRPEGGPLGAPSWMRRIYDKQAIHNNRIQWQSNLRKWFRQQNPELDDLDIEDIVQKTTNNILGNPEDVVMFRNASSGPFKERVFDIPDEMIQDFLIQDVDVVLGGYFKSAIREIELKRARFDDQGLKLRLEDMTQQSINDQRLVEAAIKKSSQEKQALAKTKEDIAKIIEKENKEIASYSKKASKQLQRDIKNITGIRDRIRGTFELNSQSVLNVEKFTDTVKSLNYSRLLGQVTFSSFSDIGTPVLINGLNRTIKDSLIPFVRDLGSIAKQFGKQNKTGVRAQSIQELKDMGIALELILNTRVKNFAELGSSVTGSKLTTFNSNTTNALSFLSGITVWNDKLRLMSGYSSMARILRATQSNKISKSDTEFLARFGIGANDLKKIGDQFKIHGTKENGRFASGSGNWTDKEAYKVFQNAIRKFVDQTIIVPGQEKPFFASTTWGSVFLQFKSFALSSYSKVFLAGLQQADLAALNGAITMVSLGMMTYYMKSLLAGNELHEDILDWIKEGVDKSGILGHLFDVNETLVKAGVGISKDNLSRYQGRNFVSTLGGPTAGLVNDIGVTGNWVRKFSQGESPSTGDVHATRRIIPFQNVFYLRKAFDAAEEGLASAVGATSKSTKKQR